MLVLKARLGNGRERQKPRQRAFRAFPPKKTENHGDSLAGPNRYTHAQRDRLDRALEIFPACLYGVVSPIAIGEMGVPAA